MDFIEVIGNPIAANVISSVSLMVSVAVALVGFIRSKIISARSQAELVSAWMNPHDNSVVLNNTSNNPVYEVVVCIVDIRGKGPRDGREVPKDYDHQAIFPVLPPGIERMTTFASYGEGSLEWVEIAFCDSAGKSWLRSGHGRLKWLMKRPVGYYGIPQPIDYFEFDCRRD